MHQLAQHHTGRRWPRAETTFSRTQDTASVYCPFYRHNPALLLSWAFKDAIYLSLTIPFALSLPGSSLSPRISAVPVHRSILFICAKQQPAVYLLIKTFCERHLWASLFRRWVFHSKRNKSLLPWSLYSSRGGDLK